VGLKEVERVLVEEEEEEEVGVTSMFPSSPHSSRQQAPHLVALDLQLLALMASPSNLTGKD